MFARNRPTRAVISLAAIVALGRGPAPVRSQEPTALQQFTRAALFARFDRNADDRLDKQERQAVREAFGGVEPPLLPDEPYRYAKPLVPPHVSRSELREADNTPEANPLTDDGAALGRVLFYDKQLSRNNTVACASCHVQERSFDDPRPKSVGYDGRQTKRSSMGLSNLRYSNVHGSRPGFFWDERAATLEDQALMPIQDEVEMGMDLRELEDKLSKLPYYPPLFQAAFGTAEVKSDRIARALAQFLRSLESWDSKFDRAAAKDGPAVDLGADFQGFTEEENLGKSLFINGVGGTPEFGCVHCHVPPTFGMPQAFNIGLNLKYDDPGLGGLDRPSNDPFTRSNDGKFKAPSLRNVALTAPYMHDGRFKTLEEVVEHYSRGVHPHENLGLAIEDSAEGKPTTGFQFTEKQKKALVAFLKTLTDRQFVTDPRFSDPFLRFDSRDD